MYGPDFAQTTISGDSLADSLTSQLISETTTASRSSTRTSLGCLQRGLRNANNVTLTAGFSHIATLLVLIYFGLAVAELMTMLFISPMKHTPITSITLHISLAFNGIILVRCVRLFAIKIIPRPSLFLRFISILTILDLMVSSLSTGLEIAGSLTESHCGALSLGILVLRLYIGFRILAQINLRRIHLATRLLQAKQIQLANLILASHETFPTRQALLERIVYQQAQVGTSRLELQTLPLKIKGMKRSSHQLPLQPPPNNLGPPRPARKGLASIQPPRRKLQL
ncbi:hypothetical protein DSO57_1008483 [Entomophthora muscae]|uniref:Uncharacterized protein n=1 Tax=Entomophthora muscae TaxID=34485 RepID=A0ACC2SWH6_9FUNG|nr:hypothetical protein DSO57_1008483 [Entomophthora muscae]